MPAAPNKDQLVKGASGPSNAQFSAGIGAFWDFITGLLGTNGTAATARAGLGASAVGSAVFTAADAAAARSALEAAQGVTGQLAGLRNKIINGNFRINQRVVSGTVVLVAGVYGHDRWKAGASGCTYTFSTSNNVTTLTITAGSLQQVIEGDNLQSGTHVLSWQGTAQGRIAAGAYGASGVTGTAVGGANLTVEFGTGTLSKVQLEEGSSVTPFEHRPIGMEETLCMRYYERNPSTAILFSVYPGGSSVQVAYTYPWKVVKRAAPTVSEVTVAGFGPVSPDIYGAAYSRSGSVTTCVLTGPIAASAEL